MIYSRISKLSGMLMLAVFFMAGVLSAMKMDNDDALNRIKQLEREIVRKDFEQWLKNYVMDYVPAKIQLASRDGSDLLKKIAKCVGPESFAAISGLGAMAGTIVVCSVCGDITSYCCSGREQAECCCGGALLCIGCGGCLWEVGIIQDQACCPCIFGSSAGCCAIGCRQLCKNKRAPK